MLPIFILIGIGILSSFGRRLIVGAIAHVFGRAIGQDALAKQPDEIHLARAGAQAWKNAVAAAALSDPLLALGFEDAGVYTIPELSGVVLRLLTRSQDSMTAVVYEHPKAGLWVELVSRFKDGSSLCYSTLAPTGMDPRPGHAIVNSPGTTPAALYQRARAEQLKKPLAPVTTASAVRDFEAAYAESMAWRRMRGVTAQEVARIAAKKAA